MYSNHGTESNAQELCKKRTGIWSHAKRNDCRETLECVLTSENAGSQK
jgi:putative hemolysin